MIAVPHPAGLDYCPAGQALAQEGLAPTVVDLEDDEAYSRLLAAAWRQGEFVVVEHDVVPWPGAIRELWDCPELYCAFEYPHGRGTLAAALGCTRFSERLTRGWPNLPERWEGRPWIEMDVRVLGAVYEATGVEGHVHGPPVGHARKRIA